MFKRYFVPIFKIFSFLLTYALLTLIFYGFGNGIFKFSTTSSYYIVIYILTFFAAACAILGFSRLDKFSLEDIGFTTKPGWYRYIINGSIAACILVLPTLLILFIFGLAVIQGFSTMNLGLILLRFVSGVIICFFGTAMVQVGLTQGYVYHFLSNKFTKGGAVLISAVFFAFINFNFASSFVGLVCLGLLSIILSLFTIRDGNVWAAIGFNFTFNFICSFIFSSPLGGTKIPGLFKVTYKAFEIFTGAGFSISSGLIAGLVFLVIIVYMMFYSNGGDRYKKVADGLSRRPNVAVLIMAAGFTILSVASEIGLWFPSGLKSDSSKINAVVPLKNLSHYSLNLSLNTEDKTLTGDENVNYVNDTHKDLNEIYFHIYPNAYVKNKNVIAISNLKVNGERTNFHIEGKDRTLLFIPLKHTLKNSEKALISLNFKLSVPDITDNSLDTRLGCGQIGFNFGNFFPIVSMYLKDGWDKHTYDFKGDPFFSETSNYDVKITAPSDQTIACTGHVEKVSDKDDKNVWIIKAPNVRDFAFVSSNAFDVQTAKFKGITIKSYSTSKMKAMKALQYGIASIKFFNEKFGKYPSSDFSIVQCDLGGSAAGMEYPNLVMITSSVYQNSNFADGFQSMIIGKNKFGFEETIVHEIAHQWWYSIVGNDEFRSAWLDEPLAQYSTFLFAKSYEGKTLYDRLCLLANAASQSYYKRIKKEKKNYNVSLDRPLNEFDSDYSTLIYDKGPLMFKALNEELGDEKFFKLTKSLVDKYKYKYITGKDLIDLTSQVAGKDMNSFYNTWLKTDYLK